MWIIWNKLFGFDYAVVTYGYERGIRRVIQTKSGPYARIVGDYLIVFKSEAAPYINWKDLT